MSRDVSNTKRLITLTRGNVRNHHLYISGHHDFFPKQCYGASNARKGTGHKLTLMVDGLPEAVETDIATNPHDGRPRNFFRKRGWVGRFLTHHGLQEGDVIAIERLDQFSYRVYPFESKSTEEATTKPASANPATAYQQTMLFPAMVGAGDEENRSGFGDTAFTKNRRQPLHRWVPWIAGFSSAFVEQVFNRAISGNPRAVTILDPFAGVGTTLVEGLKRGYNVIGFEINAYAALACEVKVSCVRCDLKALSESIDELGHFWNKRSDAKVTPKSKPPSRFRSRTPFFSPTIERDVLLLQDFIAEQKIRFVRKALDVSLGAVMVSFSNYSYEPSLSTRSAAGKHLVEHADVMRVFRDKLWEIEADIGFLQERMKAFAHGPKARVYQRSYLREPVVLSPRSVDLLVTSPPYLNNYHYVRNTRPQLYWLGLVDGNGDLKKLEEESFGRFWQTVRSGPPIQLSFELPELDEVINTIRRRNPTRGVYGGTGWANYAATYFNDCDRFFRITRRVMKAGGLVVVVIGNNIVQGVHVQTERFLAQIAERHGFRVEGMHRVRKKRTGSSIVNSSVRAGVTKKPTALYETAVEFTAPK